MNNSAIAELDKLYALEVPPEPIREDSWATLYRWAVYDLECVRLDNAALRGLAVEDYKAMCDLWYSRNHWRLAGLVGVGVAVISMVCR